MRTIKIGKTQIDIGRHYPRPTIREVKKHHPIGTVGVEIGTQQGINAKEILDYLKPKMLYLVDSYTHEGEWSKQYKEEAKELLKNYKNKQFIYKDSGEAYTEIPDKLDWVYIDGNHDYEFVKDDILKYLPKVRDKGVIGGHNIDHVGVIRAILELLPHSKLNLMENDWWMIK